jgi:hypothetical protein
MGGTQPTIWAGAASGTQKNLILDAMIVLEVLRGRIRKRRCEGDELVS